MPDTTLGDTGLVEILVGGSENTWGTKLNANFAIIDALFDDTTGHDHTADGKGKPIPTGGLTSLTGTSMGVVAAHGDGTFELATFGSGVAISDANAVGLATHALTAKTQLVDADELFVGDSAATYAMKKVVWSDLLKGAILAGTPFAHHDFGAISGTVTLELDKYGSFSLTPNGTVTFAISGALSGKLYIAMVEITNGGSFTINNPAGSTWPGGSRPALSAAATDLLFVSTRDGGTTNRWTAEIDSA